MKDLLPGYRIIKTSIAVFLCLALGKLLDYGFPIYALLSCILMMKTSTELSIVFGKDRIIGTIYGGLMAIMMQSIFIYFNVNVESWFYLFAIAFTLLFTLSIARIFNMAEYVMSMASIMVIVILCNHNTTVVGALSYSFIRIIETVIGIMIAVVVNISIKPNKAKINI